MRKVIVCLSLLTLWANHSWAQQSSASPQTARQALMEMLFSKTKGTFWEHLPEVTRTAIEKSGALTAFHQYSAMMSQVQTQAQNIQTFETGPVMLAGKDPKTGNKFEMVVERDSPRGEQDDIEVSFRTYKDGQAQRTPFMPIVTFAMKKEAQLWTLNEISVTIHLPLADPDLLKAITEKMQMKPEIHSQPGFTSSPSTQTASPVMTASQVVGSEASERLVVNAIHTIVTAEVTYANTYPNVGYTCTLSSLDGFGGGEPGPQQAMLISSGLASGRKYGYVFKLSGCLATPATKFFLTAAPSEPGSGGKAFCADQSGVVRSSEDGKAESCLASGSPIR